VPDGNDARYTGLIAITSTDTLPFSVEGESGSLVVDVASSDSALSKRVGRRHVEANS